MNYNIQYDGTTVLLTAQTFISANVTNHVKIAIADYSDDKLDSAVFIKSQSSTCP
ncbi:MAG: choice-of-anchor L domain-containing protein [Limisphaerales bacterium]